MFANGSQSEYLSGQPLIVNLRSFVQVPLLTSLSLRNNPVTDAWAYQETVLRKLKHLTVLDGKPVISHSVHSPKALLCVSPRTLREALAGRQQPRTTSAPGGGANSPGRVYWGERRSAEGWPRESLDREGGLSGGFGGFTGNSVESMRNMDAGARDGGFGEVLELALEHRRLRGLQVGEKAARANSGSNRVRSCL